MFIMSISAYAQWQKCDGKFKPGDQKRLKMFFWAIDTGGWKEKLRDFPIGVKPLWLQVYNRLVYIIILLTLVLSVLKINRHSSSSLWIGLNDIGTEASYKWSDGSPVAYTNYNYREPNDWIGVEDCLEMYRWNGKWNDLHCSMLRPYICKKTNSKCSSVFFVVVVVMIIIIVKGLNPGVVSKVGWVWSSGWT